MLCFLPWQAPAQAVAPLRVMSINVLEDTGTPGSGPDGWIYDAGPDRRDRALQVIADYLPDLLGVQEALPNQVDDLVTSSELSAYGHFMVGVNDGVRSGANDGIFYRSDRFLAVEDGAFWLSPTPDTPGSKHPSAARIRIATWMILEEIPSARRMLVISTHFDHGSAEAREFSAQLVRDRVALHAPGLPVIVMGDLNLQPDERSYALLVGQDDLAGLQLLDSYRELIPPEGPDELTRHAFTGNTAGQRIDYILQNADFEAMAAEIVRTTYDGGRYPSDHYPVTATLRLLEIPAEAPAGAPLETLAANGFEGGSDELAFVASVDSPAGSIGPVAAPVHDGAQALGFTQTAGGSKRFEVAFAPVDLARHTLVRVSLWWHAPDPSAFEASDYLKITVRYRSAEADFTRTLLNASVGRLEANDDWALVWTFLPAGVEEASLVIEASIAQVDHEHLFFDEVRLEGARSPAPIVEFGPRAGADGWRLGWASVPGLTYQVRCSADLQTWLDCGAAPPVVVSENMTTLDLPPVSAARQFYQAVVKP